MQGPQDIRREREEGRMVYPAMSRRSGGLSLGVDLFPAGKSCSFDCPYCEVFLPDAESEGAGFSVAAFETELYSFLDSLASRPSAGEFLAGEVVRDLCLSGNGEPTLSPFLGEVLGILARVRRERPALLGSAPIVLITNSTGFLSAPVSALLERFWQEEGLVVWAKLDAGSEERFGLMAGLAGPGPGPGPGPGGGTAGLSLERVAAGILGFARRVPVIVQTMLCAVDGRSPSRRDLEDYVATLSRLLVGGAHISELHLYTFARPSPSGRCAALPDAELARHAAFVASATGLRVRAFGAAAELSLAEVRP